MNSHSDIIFIVFVIVPMVAIRIYANVLEDKQDSKTDKK